MNNCSGHGTCNSSGLCNCDAGYGLADCSVGKVSILYNRLMSYYLAHEALVNGTKYQLNEGSWAYYTVDLSKNGTFVISPSSLPLLLMRN